MNNFKLDNDQMKNLEKLNEILMPFIFKIFGWIGNVIDFFKKNTKTFYVIIILFILFKVGTYLVAFEPRGVYEITTTSGVVYNTNEIEVKDGCVYFKTMNDKHEMIICGGCTIVKSK